MTEPTLRQKIYNTLWKTPKQELGEDIIAELEESRQEQVNQLVSIFEDELMSKR
jgi:hypothetical protein